MLVADVSVRDTAEKYYCVIICLVSSIIQLQLRPKKLLFPETRPTLAFTPDPKNFMDLFVLKFFSGSISIGLVFRQTVLLYK